MEAATNALGRDSVQDLKNRIKEKTDLLEEVTEKFKELEERTSSAEEELKTKLQ